MTNKQSNREKAEELRADYKRWKAAALNTGGWFPVFNGFKLFLPSISGNALKLYLYFGLHSKYDKGESWHSIESIASFFGKSPRAINDWVKELQDAGLIERMQMELNQESHTFLKTYPAELRLVVDSNEDDSREIYYRELATIEDELRVHDNDVMAMSRKGNTLFRLGHSCMRQGSTTEAMRNFLDSLAAYQAALSLDPNNSSLSMMVADSLGSLGVAQARVGMYDESLLSLRQALARLDSIAMVDSETYRTALRKKSDYTLALARCLLEKGDLQASIPVFEMGIAHLNNCILNLPPSRTLRLKLGEAHLELGVALLRLGIPEQARVQFSAALSAFDQAGQLPRALLGKKAASNYLEALESQQVTVMHQEEGIGILDAADIQSELMGSLDRDPRTAFLLAYTELEAILSRLVLESASEVENNGTRARQSQLVATFASLVQRGALDRTATSTFLQVRSVRNRLLHGRRELEVNWPKMVDKCLRLIRDLERV